MYAALCLSEFDFAGVLGLFGGLRVSGFLGASDVAYVTAKLIRADLFWAYIEVASVCRINALEY
jgi:hypothetical protein